MWPIQLWHDHTLLRCVFIAALFIALALPATATASGAAAPALPPTPPPPAPTPTPTFVLPPTPTPVPGLLGDILNLLRPTPDWEATRMAEIERFMSLRATAIPEEAGGDLPAPSATPTPPPTVAPTAAEPTATPAQPAPTPPPAGDYLRDLGGSIGADISQYQGKIDFEKMRDAGIEFLFIRASAGATWDTRYAANWLGAGKAGIPRGAYHYYHPRVKVKKQLDAFLGAVGSDWGELPPAIDVESTAIDPEDLAWFLAEVEKASGRVPIIYTSVGTWPGGDDPRFVHYHLWVAAWGARDPALPGAWRSFLVHQYSSAAPGRAYGVSSARLDLDYWARGYVAPDAGYSSSSAALLNAYYAALARIHSGGVVLVGGPGRR